MKKLLVIFVVLITALVLMVTVVLGSETEKSLAMSADGIKELRIDCGAGFLKVAGVAGLDRIEVLAEIEARGEDSDEMEDFIKDHVELFLEKRGTQAILKASIENGWSFFGSGDSRINLTVRVPKSMPIEIDDGSGEMIVEEIDADVSIDDGSGSIRVERVRGNVEIDDNSGDLDIRDVSGDVSVEDGSGGIDIDKVGGSVTVDDGSGGIYIDDIGKDVVIEEAGSGSVRIDNVKGRVIRHDRDHDDDDDEDDDDSDDDSRT
jgi:hypothetical protein